MDGLLINIAVRLIEVWALLNGYNLYGGFDFDDPACVQYHGPHIVVCRGVRGCPDSLEPFSVCRLRQSLERFLNTFRPVCPMAEANFHVYDIAAYPQPDGITTLYISVFV